MSDLPYSKEVLRLAAEAAGVGRLAPPCRSHTEHNPACGDRCTVDVRIEDGRIAAVAHDTRACVLTQASASILGTALAGHTRGDVDLLRDAVQTMLNGGPAPQEPFARYRHLADVAAHPGRYRCVLLPIDAALKAMEASDAGEPS